MQRPGHQQYRSRYHHDREYPNQYNQLQHGHPPYEYHAIKQASAPPVEKLAVEAATAARVVKVAQAVYNSPVLEKALKEREGGNPLFAFLRRGR